jgi:hypothetical protein
MCLWVSYKEKIFYFRILKVTEDSEERGRIRSWIRIHLSEGTDLRIRILIRIRTKLSRMPNNASNPTTGMKRTNDQLITKPAKRVFDLNKGQAAAPESGLNHG